MKIADQVRQCRLRARLTQAELAARLGTTQPAVSKWERGIDEPRLSTLVAIAHACGGRLRVELEPPSESGVDRAQIRAHLALTPRQRLDAVANVAALRARARRRSP